MLWIAIVGGLLVMMGQHDRSEACNGLWVLKKSL
jgi:hypothetical protein